MEIYSSGWRGAPAKGVGRATGARVQIPDSPPETSSFILDVFLYRKLFRFYILINLYKYFKIEYIFLILN